MKGISQLVVHVFELAEAGGSSLRANVRNEVHRACVAATDLVYSGAFLIVAIPLCIAGVLLVGAGFMWWLETQVSRPLAALLTGVALLIASAAFVMIARKIARRQRA